MNKIKGHITEVEVSGNLSVITVNANSNALKSIVIETPDTVSYLKQGHQVYLCFKETEVSLGIGVQDNHSILNQIPSTIKTIKTGSLLTKLVLNSASGEITSIISTYAYKTLGLQENQNVVALVKLNEIMLSEE